MDTKTLVKALKMAVREVIKEELTEILRDGLQSTINEMTMSTPKKIKTVQTYPGSVASAPKRKPAVQFTENKWANVLNQTDALIEQQPVGMNSFAEMMNEEVDTMQFNSADARGFGQMRQTMTPTTQAPQVMEDPETGKVYNVDPTVAAALTRDYSALMSAIDKKKGK
jgi:hypothetical protein